MPSGCFLTRSPAWPHTPVIRTLGRWRQKYQEFGVIFSCIASWRPSYITWDPTATWSKDGILADNSGIGDTLKHSKISHLGNFLEFFKWINQHLHPKIRALFSYWARFLALEFNLFFMYWFIYFRANSSELTLGSSASSNPTTGHSVPADGDHPSCRCWGFHSRGWRMGAGRILGLTLNRRSPNQDEGENQEKPAAHGNLPHPAHHQILQGALSVPFRKRFQNLRPCPRTHVTVSWTNRKRSTSAPRKKKKKKKLQKKKKTQLFIPMMKHQTLPEAFVFVFQRVMLSVICMLILFFFFLTKSFSHQKSWISIQNTLFPSFLQVLI